MNRNEIDPMENECRTWLLIWFDSIPIFDKTWFFLSAWFFLCHSLCLWYGNNDVTWKMYLRWTFSSINPHLKVTPSGLEVISCFILRFSQCFPTTFNFFFLLSFHRWIVLYGWMLKQINWWPFIMWDDFSFFDSSILSMISYTHSFNEQSLIIELVLGWKLHLQEQKQKKK